MKTLHTDLFPETLLVNLEGEQIFTTSLKIAERFDKRHDRILRAIDDLFNQVSHPNFGVANSEILAFNRLNFKAVEYLDAQKKPRKMYKISHDGFAILVMGFTGEKALLWKIEFLNAFREMERQLIAKETRFAKALDIIRPNLRPVVEATEQGLNRAAIGANINKSANSVSYHRSKARQFGLLN